LNNLLQAITTKTVGSILSSDVGGRIFLDQAPEGTEFPYIVFFVVSAVQYRTFTEKFTDALVQFSIFSDSPGAAEITTIYNDLKDLFDECSLSISGSTLVWMREENLTTVMDEITTPGGTVGVKHYAVDYEIKTSLN
jgi:hypothetical protein